jgi:hypothetical protein
VVSDRPFAARAHRERACRRIYLGLRSRNRQAQAPHSLPPAHDAGPSEGDEERLQIIARELEQAIDADPPAWHAWADLPLFRQAPAVRATRDADGDA